MPVFSSVSLCSTCHHCKLVQSKRGSTFFLCGRASKDLRFVKYPVQPVVRCGGFEVAGQ